MAGLTAVKGGYDLSDERRRAILTQRSITHTVNEGYVQVGATFLRPSSKNPTDPKWNERQHKDTDLQSWIDDEDRFNDNVGFILHSGWMDVDVDAPDPDFNETVFLAMDALGVDTRFRFGRESKGVASHALVQLTEDDYAAIEHYERFAPREFRLKGERYHVELRTNRVSKTKRDAIRAARQVMMPGSLYSHPTIPNECDPSIWYKGRNEASDVRQLAATTPRRTDYESLVRATAFATVAYLCRDHWVEGSRQTFALRTCGWLARVVREGAAMNANEVTSREVFCPIDSEEVGDALIEMLCEAFGDDEPHMRKRAFHDALEKLDRNPDARVPGWPAIQESIGQEAVNALRGSLMPGSDVSVLSQMAERYLFDESDNNYIDRKRFSSSSAFVYEGMALIRRHKGDSIRVKDKNVEAFPVFERSEIRGRVDGREMYPEVHPGSIYRVTPLGDVVEDDYDDDSLLMFNTWRGWPVQPTVTVNDQLMGECEGRLDQLLGYLTRDDQRQIGWIKDWIAFTLKYPATKQQDRLGGRGRNGHR